MPLTKQDLKAIKTIVSDEINGLAVITHSSFVAVEKRFVKMDERFEKIDERFDAVDQRFEKIDDQLSYQNQKIVQNHRELSDKIDRVTTMLSEDMEPIYDDVTNLKRRVTKLENVGA